MNPSTESQSNVRRGTFLFMLAAVTVAFFGLIKDFLMACFWAAILAIVFDGIYLWFSKRMRPNIAALITTIAILLSVVTPIALVTLAVIGESELLYSEFQEGDLRANRIIENLREAAPQIEQWFRDNGIPVDDLTERLTQFVRDGVAALGDTAVATTQGAINLVIQFTLMLYLLFFFIRDGRDIVNAIQRALPLGDEIEEKLFRKFAAVSRATLKGTLVVAVVQGTLGGITFALLGIPGATLWGVMMILLSLLPVGGSAIVWFPAAVILFLGGQVIKAVILVIIGSLFIGLIDNVLRPRLVSRETSMPDYLVLIATLGGIALFGLSGFIIGPVIASLFITFWEITGQLFGGSQR